MNPFHAKGASAESLVTSKLLDQGFSVARPVVDEGYDLLVNHSVRVQIKSSSEQSAGLAFHFHVPRLRAVDVVVLVGRHESGRVRYWVVPITVFGHFADTPSISLPTEYGRRIRRPRRFHPFWKFENAWQVVAPNMAVAA